MLKYLIGTALILTGGCIGLSRMSYEPSPPPDPFPVTLMGHQCLKTPLTLDQAGLEGIKLAGEIRIRYSAEELQLYAPQAFFSLPLSAGQTGEIVFQNINKIKGLPAEYESVLFAERVYIRLYASEGRPWDEKAYRQAGYSKKLIFKPGQGLCLGQNRIFAVKPCRKPKAGQSIKKKT